MCIKNIHPDVQEKGDEETEDVVVKVMRTTTSRDDEDSERLVRGGGDQISFPTSLFLSKLIIIVNSEFDVLILWRFILPHRRLNVSLIYCKPRL